MKIKEIRKIGAVSVGLGILLQGCSILFAPSLKFQEHQKPYQEQISRAQEGLPYSLEKPTTIKNPINL